MIVRKFDRIGEVYYEDRLPNGLTVRVVPKRGFAKKYAFLAVNFGSIDTKFTLDGVEHRVPDGIAHYLEHKMFDLPEGSAMNLFSANGGNPNAFTAYEMTAYYFSCTENFSENLRTLLRMVLTPWFTEESVEKERGIIAQEIKMYEDSAESRVFEDLFADLYSEHPIRVPIAGTVESIGEITAQGLMDCYRAFYRPSNMMLCVAGDVDPKKVMNIAASQTAEEASALPIRDYGGQEAMVPAKTRSQRYMEVSMPTFSIGFKCEPAEGGEASLRQEIIGDLAAEILVGESSRLYQRLYEEGLIDAAFSAGLESMKSACLLSAGGDSDHPEEILQAILEEARRIEREGVDSDLFLRLKKSAIGRRTRDLDSFESICYHSCACFFEDLEFFRFPEAYDSVSQQDVQDFLRQTVRPERAAMAVVSPEK